MEETISLKEIFDVLKKHLRLIIGLTIGAAIISALVTFFILTPNYQASTQFIVNQSPSQQQDSSYDINDIRTNVELINTYNVIIKSPAILEEVVDELNLEISADNLANLIQVSNAEQSQVVNVTVTHEDPEKAVTIANTTVEVFQEEIPDLMSVNNVSILSKASIPQDPNPVSPKPLLNIAIAIVVGLMAGVGIAFLLEYLDNTIKSEQDIEKTLGLPVMGVVSTITKDDLAVHKVRSTKASPVNVRRKSIGS